LNYQKKRAYSSVNKESAAALNIMVRGGLRECHRGRRRGTVLFPPTRSLDKAAGKQELL